MKKILSLLMALAMSATMIISVSAADKDKAEPSVFVNGSEIIFEDQNAKIINDVTLVPARGVFEAMRNTVEWNGETREVTVTASTGVVEVLITIDSDIMKVTTYKSIFNRTEEEVTLEVPAQIINDRTMIPLRAVSEAFNCDVKWDADKYAVIITTGEKPLLGGTTSSDDVSDDVKTEPEVIVDNRVSMALSTDATTLTAGEEFSVYVDVTNIPEGYFVGGVTVGFAYDKNVFEYVGGTLINDNDEAFEAVAKDERTDDYELGAKVMYVTIDETASRTKDGHVFKATFKSVNGESGTIGFSNRFASIIGYETYIHVTPIVVTVENDDDVVFDGENLNLMTTPITIGE